MNKFMTATEARKKFFSLIRLVQKSDTTVTITHEGLPKVVMISFGQFEKWQKTMKKNSGF